MNRPDDWVSGRELDRWRSKERKKEEGDAQALSGLLGNYLAKSSLGEALLPASPTFRAAWARVAGPMAERCTPCAWERGTLWVSVPDPGWKFEFRLRMGDFARALGREGFPVRMIRMK